MPECPAYSGWLLERQILLRADTAGQGARDQESGTTVGDYAVWPAVVDHGLQAASEGTAVLIVHPRKS